MSLGNWMSWNRPEPNMKITTDDVLGNHTRSALPVTHSKRTGRDASTGALPFNHNERGGTDFTTDRKSFFTLDIITGFDCYYWFFSSRSF